MVFDSAEDYTVRWYDPSDRDEFVSLYRETFGPGGGDDWFEWKYVDNPRTTHVPILVAEADGTLAGARAQTPFLMRAGDDTALAMRFGDTMVHPDHRRRGVFSRLVERALDHYRDMPVAFCYNVPNDLSRPGFLDAGGEIVANLPSYYRVQNPRALAANRDDAVVSLASRLGTPAARGYLALRDRLASPPENATVTRHSTVPVSALSTLYERAPPRSVHAVRDPTFLEWRYQNPRWEYDAYTASVDGRLAAAVVTGTRTGADGITVTNIVDVLPLTATTHRDTGLRTLFDAVVADNEGVDVLAYCGTDVPSDVLRSYGFHYDGRAPLDAVTTPTRLVSYDLTADGDWSLGGVDLTAAENWGLSYVELDDR